ncbi:MAG: carbonic anhydrase [Patescibacteria group bacterium]|jgi:carbonic anhydrase
MAHICDAAVVACIDFRFQKFIRDWTDKELAGKKFDYIGFAGSTKNLDTVLGQIDISVRLHQIKQVVLIHHEECGAYGAESTPERHTTDLKKAQETVLGKWPQLTVDLYYLHLDGTFEKVV